MSSPVSNHSAVYQATLNSTDHGKHFTLNGTLAAVFKLARDNRMRQATAHFEFENKIGKLEISAQYYNGELTDIKGILTCAKFIFKGGYQLSSDHKDFIPLFGEKEKIGPNRGLVFLGTVDENYHCQTGQVIWKGENFPSTIIQVGGKEKSEWVGPVNLLTPEGAIFRGNSILDDEYEGTLTFPFGWFLDGTFLRSKDHFILITGSSLYLANTPPPFLVQTGKKIKGKWENETVHYAPCGLKSEIKLNKYGFWTEITTHYDETSPPNRLLAIGHQKKGEKIESMTFILPKGDQITTTRIDEYSFANDTLQIEFAEPFRINPLGYSNDYLIYEGEKENGLFIKKSTLQPSGKKNKIQ